MFQFKPLIFLFFLGFSFLSSTDLRADHEPGHCVVTNVRGNFEPGTLVRILRTITCKKITFNVARVDPLMDFVDLNGGEEIDGRGLGGHIIELQLDPSIVRDHPTVGECLLRIQPISTGNPSPDPVKVSNLIIRHPQRTGICMKPQNSDGTGPYIDGSKFTNVTIRDVTRGIDVGGSNNNEFRNVNIFGSEGTGEGIFIGSGEKNKVEGGRIENFQTGIKVSGEDNKITKVRFVNIPENGKLIDNAASQPRFVPREIKAAFVTPSQFTLTGKIYKDTDSIEIYVGTPRGSRTDYQYKIPIDVSDPTTNPSSQRVADDPDPGRSTLGADDRRFVHTINISRDRVQPNQRIIVNAFYKTAGGKKTTSEFQATPLIVAEEVNQDKAIVGGTDCSNIIEAQWFWHSFDRSTLTDKYKGWDINYDGDTYGGQPLNNSCVTEICTDPTQAEDLNRNCRVDQRESNPNNAASSYDADNDTIPDYHVLPGRRIDNCLGTANPDQLDSDGDGIGDACEGDSDADGIDNVRDNCPTVHNTNQRDSDKRPSQAIHRGDACEELVCEDADEDGDGVHERDLRCPGGASGRGRFPVDDTDGDGVKTISDNCPFDANPDQLDTDQDGVGNVCDPDKDNDGLTNEEETEAGTLELNPDTDSDSICDGPGMGFERNGCIRPRDNCPLISNRNQFDQDEDGIGDACDNNDDSDGDGTPDAVDNCPWIKNVSQSDWDTIGAAGSPGDGVGDVCDPDDDNDGLDDATESGIFNPRRKGWDGTNPVMSDFELNYLNTRNVNHRERDVDHDNMVDGVDICPNFYNLNQRGNFWNSDNRDIASALMDSNYCGGQDPTDVDGDGKRDDNGDDNCPFIPNKWQRDLDLDGIGDACDLDDDSDNGGDNSKGNDEECVQVLLDLRAYTEVKCNPRGGPCSRTCDFDESAKFRQAPWDPNSDHEFGDIFRRGDLKCDGKGSGFDNIGSLTKCEPSDPCPEVFNRPGFESSCVSRPIDGGESPVDGSGRDETPNPDLDGDGIPDLTDNCKEVPNADQLNADQDDFGDACDPRPTISDGRVLQGGGGSGCMLVTQSNPNGFPLIAILGSLILFLFLSRRNLT